jgi:hypothetical protein
MEYAQHERLLRGYLRICNECRIVLDNWLCDESDDIGRPHFAEAWEFWHSMFWFEARRFRHELELRRILSWCDMYSGFDKRYDNETMALLRDVYEFEFWREVSLYEALL